MLERCAFGKGRIVRLPEAAHVLGDLVRIFTGLERSYFPAVSMITLA
jgi:hypothetical protein